MVKQRAPSFSRGPVHSAFSSASTALVLIPVTFIGSPVGLTVRRLV